MHKHIKPKNSSKYADRGRVKSTQFSYIYSSLNSTLITNFGSKRTLSF